MRHGLVNLAMSTFWLSTWLTKRPGVEWMKTKQWECQGHLWPLLFGSIGGCKLHSPLKSPKGRPTRSALSAHRSSIMTNNQSNHSESSFCMSFNIRISIIDMPYQAGHGSVPANIKAIGHLHVLLTPFGICSPQKEFVQRWLGLPLTPFGAAATTSVISQSPM